MSADVVVVAHGRPIVQGSKTRGRFGMWDDNAKTLHPWRRTVTAAATAVREDTHGPILAALQDAPLEVEVTFTFSRPGSHYRSGRNAHLLRANAPAWPTRRQSGDLDKLQRACFDAITDAKLWGDDAQVAIVTARKVYVREGIDALSEPGLLLRIRPLVATVALP